MRHATLVAVLALTLGFPSLVAPLSAQECPTDEDLQFARGLIERRMHDRARQILERIIADPRGSDADRASANLEMANLYRDEFTRGLTLKARMAASEKADAAYHAFVTRFGDHPRIWHARRDYAEFLVYLGRYRIQLHDEVILVGGSPEKAEEHRAVARAKLKTSIDLFDQLIAEIRDAGQEEERATLFELSRYYRAILAYDIGRAEKDEASRLAAFLEGIGDLEDYIFENEDNLRGFRGYLYKGLCHRELAEESHRADALACFEGVIRAFERAIADPGSGWKTWKDALTDPGAKDLLERAYWRFAETCNRFGDHEKAIALVDQLEKIHTAAGADFANPGLRALLQRAEARFLTGRVAEAVRGVSEVADRAGAANRFIQFHCERRLARYLDRIEDATRLDPALVFKAAKGAFAQRRWNEARRRFRTVLTIRPEASPMALACWNYIGHCYERLDFPRECALATATGAFAMVSADGDRALTMAQHARRTLARIARATRSAADKARLTQHKRTMEQTLTGGYGARFEPALSAMSEGKFELAIEEFRSIPEVAVQYELAQAYIAWCTLGKAERDYRRSTTGRRATAAECRAARARRNAGYESAIQLADRFFARAGAKADWERPARSRYREQAVGVAVLSRAAALKGLGRSEEALDTLAHFERPDSDGVSRSQARQARVLKVQVLLLEGDLPRAEVELHRLEADFADAVKSVVNLKGRLGAELRRRAGARAKDGREAEALAALEKSVDYRRAWVKGTTEPKAETLLSLGKDYYALNRFEEARVVLAGVVAGADRAEKSNRRRHATLRLARTYLARCLVWQGKYVEAEPIFRVLHEQRKRDKRLLKEYASLLTGTTRVVDGTLVYLPGRGAHPESARKGYRLWERVARMHEDAVDERGRGAYLEARFHQNLVRWALGESDKARASIRLLRVSFGPRLGRAPGAREPGPWEARYAWLEKQLSRPAPQAPPAPPARRSTKNS